jgi:hypothetical protein
MPLLIGRQTSAGRYNGGHSLGEPMNFDKIVEEKIKEAMENGEFDNLEGSGKPLRGLNAYFATPENVRIGYSVLKNSGFVPEEVELLKEINALKEEAAFCTEAERKKALNSRIAELQLKYDLLMDQYRKSSCSRST